MADGSIPQGLLALPQRGLSPEAERQLSGWAWFAALSLAIAGAFALLLALSRTPGIGTLPFWPIGFFQKGLVIHVVFSFVLWFLAVFGALMHLATEALDGDPRLAWLGRVALWATAAAMPMLFVPGFLDRGEASLNNYVPAIADPLYYGGLVALALGGTATALRLILALHGRIGRQPADVIAIAAGAIIFLVALMCFVLALVALGDTPPSPAFNEVLFWGGGHVLQFVNTLLLMVSWHLLTRNLPGSPISSPAALKIGAWWLLLIALATPLLYAGETGIKEARTSTFTDLQYAFAPPSLLAAGALAAVILKFKRGGRALPWSDPASLCLLLSPLVFGLGGILGLFVNGADTRTPAHYHCVVAGITLAFMGLFYGLFLPLLRRHIVVKRAHRIQIWLFAVGQSAAAMGLFLAGSEGTARKVAGADQALRTTAEYIGLGLNGLGAAIAVVGGLMFLWTVMKALLGPAISPGLENPGTSAPEV
jgi:cytochrome c oxidase subunit I